MHYTDIKKEETITDKNLHLEDENLYSEDKWSITVQ